MKKLKSLLYSCLALGICLSSQQMAYSQSGCAEQRCYGPAPACSSNSCRRSAACYEKSPPESPQPPQLDEGTAGYSAPTPNGTYTGGANSLGLRLGGLRIPEINIPLPTVQLPHLVFLHRTPEVALDSATAPIHRDGEVHDFAQVDRQPVQLDEGDKPKPQPPQLDQQQNCYPPGCCPPVPTEGCTTMRFNTSDPWLSADARESLLKEQKIARLEAQVSEMHALLEQLAKQKEQQSQQESSTHAPEHRKSKAIDHRNRRDEVQSAEITTNDEQAQQIAILQAKLEGLSKSQQTAMATVREEDVAEQLIRQETRQVERKLPKTEKSSAKSGLFNRLGMTLTRR